MSELHPDFVYAHPSKKWTGPLAGLRRQLDIEADRLWSSSRQSRESWVFRVLPHGVCVAARRIGRERFVRISRSSAPGPSAAKKWETELATFVRQLKLDGWDSRPDLDAPGVAVVYTCHSSLLCPCGSKVDDNAQLFGDPKERRCSSCQLKRGRGEVA